MDEQVHDQIAIEAEAGSTSAIGLSTTPCQSIRAINVSSLSISSNHRPDFTLDSVVSDFVDEGPDAANLNSDLSTIFQYNPRFAEESYTCRGSCQEYSSCL